MVKDFIDELYNDSSLLNTCSYKKLQYLNVPCCFDIEASSFYENDEKRATMYVWQFGIKDHIYIGRTWNEYVELINEVHKLLYTSLDKRLIIYVHNLSYEFQWIKELFTWDNVFALDMRKPIYAVTDQGIEYRCSYMLSGFSLAKLSDNLISHTVKKMVGDLDYSLVRHSETPLTDLELGYCINDVKVVIAYIEEQIEQFGNIARIPLTNTGRVREYCRQHCLTKSYRQNIKSLTIEPTEYEQLKKCFAGGFTHANVDKLDWEIKDVYSNDFTSSYPAVMCSRKFPMSKGILREHLTMQDFLEYIEKYCCMFDIKYTNIRLKSTVSECIISRHKCKVKNDRCNNGRIYSADELITTITEVDFRNIEKFYDYDEYVVSNLWFYQKAYLPKEIIECVLELYSKKTTLKGVAGKEAEYQNYKGMLNSVYGMCVTDIVRDDTTYYDDWTRTQCDIIKTINDYNKSTGRFLFYPWGVWITAYARENLFSGILDAKDDYVYSDTDSIKATNYYNHKEYYDNYNKQVVNDINDCLNYYNIDTNLANPVDINNEHHQLGIWDFEGKYDRFKTLGAKRYLTEKNNKLELTVSGVNKKIGSEYLKTFDDPFTAFADDLIFPRGTSGKKTHTYIDKKTSGTVTDYLGNKAEYSDLSSVHIEEAEYSLSISDELIAFINFCKENKINGRNIQ